MKKHLLTLCIAVFMTGYAFSQTTLIPYGATWKYLDNGTNQGTTWKNTGFNDSGWKSGKGQLGYGDGDEATIVSYGTNSSSKYITTYFRSTFNVASTSTYANYKINARRDDGIIVYINGTEVFRDNMPVGTVSYTTLSSTNCSDDGAGEETITLSAAASAVVAGTNTIAVEIHQTGGTSSDISFDLQLLGIAATAPVQLPRPDHVVIVVMENHSFAEIIGNTSAPFLNSLANGNNTANFIKSFAITHPSQPNYLHLFSGANQGVTNDNTPTTVFTTPNLGAQLAAKGFTFKGYSEDLPSVGYTGATSGKYARKHAPWINWQGTGTNGIPSTSNQPFTAFPQNNFTALPSVSFVIPNLNNDIHDGTISQGDTWVKNNLNAYITWAMTHNSLFILTFDEDDNTEGNQITTMFAGPMVKKGQYSNTINHYNVLRTLEDMYGLSYAGGAASSTPITNCWTGTARMGNMEDAPELQSTDNHLLLVSPNPVTSLLTATVNLIEEEQVEITVTDELGKTVAILYKGAIESGSRTFEFNSADLLSGNYYLILKGAKNSKSVKFVKN